MICGIIKHLSALIETRTVTGAVPRVFGRIPFQRAAKMRAAFFCRRQQVFGGFKPIDKQLRFENASRRTKDLREIIFPAADHIAKQHRRHHGACHPPFTKTARNIQIRRVFGIVSDIRNVIKTHTVLCRPVIPLRRMRIIFIRKPPQLIPISTAFASAVPASAQKQEVSIITKRKTCLTFVNVHALHILCILKCNHIGAVLIQL